MPSSAPQEDIIYPLKWYPIPFLLQSSERLFEKSDSDAYRMRLFVQYRGYSLYTEDDDMRIMIIEINILRYPRFGNYLPIGSFISIGCFV